MSLKLTQQNNSHAKSYGKLAIITIIAVYLLILVGGIVRSSGSGMGCPDWPKCFGNWVPPTDESQLPAGYQQVYMEKRLAKNERLALFLERIGMANTASELRTEEAILQESEFNAVNTWIEYINRLVGVMIGLLIIATFYRSLKFWNYKRSITILSGVALVLVLFQGWLGSLVVSTNLLPWMVTIHMLPALLLVALLELAAFRAKEQHNRRFSQVKGATAALWGAIVLTVLQVVLGTQVREAIDTIAAGMGFQNRVLWVDQLNVVFYIHRSFSWVLLLVHIYLVYICSRARNRELSRWATVLLVVVLAEAVVGIVLAYFGFPAYLQPVHLLLGTLLFGLQFYMLLIVRSSTTEQVNHKLQTC
ncbi:heme A synthase [Cesiribacter sp. SM1]|uniref:COX15/CtaA family protein n=1 Tax=Cesiribacter sp. SM1 TaxID=2861196 RepID=UPI001CD47C98|nr:COX15/CtaA family protein [Cesiribacter sp. SM1]